MSMRGHCASREQMIADIELAFPGAFVRPLEQFTTAYGPEGRWLQFAGNRGEIGGEPIYCSTADGEEPYDGYLHTGFIEWLANRGWGHECYDGESYFLLPISDFDL